MEMLLLANRAGAGGWVGKDFQSRICCLKTNRRLDLSLPFGKVEARQWLVLPPQQSRPSWAVWSGLRALGAVS